MSLLIVLRGNSGSGKSTLAQALQRELGAVWIEQDYFRRTVLGEVGNYSPLTIELIEQTVALTLSHDRTVIADGMFNARKYSASFNTLRGAHAGHSLFYAYDLTLADTLRRHATRPRKQASFGEQDMRGWYQGWDPLNGIEEQRISAHESLGEAMARILDDVRNL